MGLQERIDALQPRERGLLMVFVGLFVVVAVLLIPLAVSATLSERRTENEQLQEALDRLFAERDEILETNQANEAILGRYKTAPPPLAGFISRHAKSLDLEIPGFKDKPVVPHGKKYEEQATEIRLKKVGMRELVLFLEKLEQASFPLSLNQLVVRKRGTGDDTWDATMTVSAYRRKPDEVAKTQDDAEQDEEDEE